MALLSQFPLDVLLYISSFAGLLDIISFSMVCKATYFLSSERTFWISALQNQRRIRPIACTTHEDLIAHDIHSLKRIARHSLRLQRNWNSENPQIMGQIKLLGLGLSSHDSVFRVPGTELYIFNCPDRRTIELWHIGWQKMVGEPITTIPRIFDVSSGVDLPRKFMLAFLSLGVGLRYYLLVVCVEYGPTSAALKLILKHEFFGRHHWGVYLDQEIVGTLCYDWPTASILVATVNLSTEKEILFDPDLSSLQVSLTPAQIYRSGTILVDGDLCILVVDTPTSGKAWIFTVPRALLLPDSSRDTTSISKTGFTFFEGYCRSREDDNRQIMIVTTTTPYGVQAMTINTASEDSTTDVVFWVQPQSNLHENNGESPLVPVTLPKGIPGSLFSFSDANLWHPMLQTFSGLHGLIISSVGEGDSERKQVLRLVSCDPSTRAVSYRDLSLPESLTLSRIHGLALDDHLGVLSVINSDGVLFAIPYA